MTVTTVVAVGSVLALFLFPFVVFSSILNLYLRNIRVGNSARRAGVLGYLGVGDSPRRKLIGFFHPYCHAGGGGERVLWTAVSAIQRTEPDIVSVVYSGDVDASKEEIIAKVKTRFNIVLDPSTLHFVFLQSRTLVEGTSWPLFTLMGQSIGSMYLAWEAMTKLIPDLYIDTMGYAFTFHVVSALCDIPIGAYIHYPMISTDMLSRVKSRTKWHTNSDTISSSTILSRGKLLYYRLTMYYYSLSLRRASFLMVNSSWTKAHIDSILHHSDLILDIIHLSSSLFLSIFIKLNKYEPPRAAPIVYPPCDTREMAKFPLEKREQVILSVAQFRPEKSHATQLHSLRELLMRYPEHGRPGSRVKLVLMGGSRGPDDAARVEELRLLAEKLDIQDYVEFVVNASYPDVLCSLSKARLGLSTMVDEHFGINIVEFMAAGVIPVTHASGGPLNDIVVPFDGQPTGYHATTPEAFAKALHTALTLDPVEDVAMRKRARTWAVQRFSEEEFIKGWHASGWRDWLR